MMENILPKFGCLQESAVPINIRNLLSLKPIMLLCPYVLKPTDLKVNEKMGRTQKN